MVLLVGSGLLALLCALILAGGGAVLMVRRGRAYSLFIVAAGIMLLGGLARSVLYLIYGVVPGTQAYTPSFATLQWVSIGVGLVTSTATALAWAAALFPLLQPDTVLPADLDGPLAEGGA